MADQLGDSGLTLNDWSRRTGCCDTWMTALLGLGLCANSGDRLVMGDDFFNDCPEDTCDYGGVYRVLCSQ